MARTGQALITLGQRAARCAQQHRGAFAGLRAAKHCHNFWGHHKNPMEASDKHSRTKHRYEQHIPSLPQPAWLQECAALRPTLPPSWAGALPSAAAWRPGGENGRKRMCKELHLFPTRLQPQSPAKAGAPTHRVQRSLVQSSRCYGDAGVLMKWQQPQPGCIRFPERGLLQGEGDYK